MRFLIPLSCLCLSFSLFAGVDKSENLNGVALKSSKEASVRSYTGSISRSFPYPLEFVKKSVTNFAEKCNNSYRSKRKYSSPDKECKYHNEHLIESFVVNAPIPQDKSQGVSESYLLGRQIYNRGRYGYYELVQVKDGINHQHQKMSVITLRMLDDAEVKAWTKPQFSKDSAFDKSTATYILTEVSPSETELIYQYEAETDHWILNKELSVPQVFASISKSINDLMETVEVESSYQKRKLASEE